MAKKLQRFILIMLMCSYIVFVVSTFVGNEFAIELFSTVTSAVAGTLILFCLEGLFEFYLPAISISIGIYCWAAADVIRFANHYILSKDPLSLLVRTLYLLPNYFFGLGLVIYIIKKLKGRRRELSYLMSNAFCISGIAFVLIRKLLITLSEGRNVSAATELRALLYFFINFFIILLVIHLFRMVGTDNVRRGTNLLPAGILLYILFDFRYNYLEAIGEEPEDVITNLIYMLFMILMAVGIMMQSRKRYTYFFGVSDFSNRAIRRRVAYSIAAMVISVLALFTGFFELDEVLYIIILLMAYMIMTYISRTDMLNESLLEQQMQQNEILEEKVEEKTKELTEANEYLERLSSTDLLTGLYNRRYGYEYLDKLHEECVKNSGSYAIFCIDLNQFKPINDTYGHEMGDRVLKEFGERMLSLPDRYIAVRTGGDEFMLVMKGEVLAGDASRGVNTADNEQNTTGNEKIMLTEEVLEKEAAAIQKLFNTPVTLDTYVFHLSASIGISSFPHDSDNAAALLQFADEAMYVIKHSGHKDGYGMFDASLESDNLKNQELKQKLYESKPDKDFMLKYQPQYDVNEGEVTGVGVEVFPHLANKELDDISPAVLIPLAEEIGLMNGLGTWLTDTSMHQISNWQEEFGKELTLTINLSPLQIIDNEYIDFLEHIGESYGIDHSRVTLDIDNDVIMSSVESSKATIKRLRDQGFRLSLNNFGGGDINLSYVLECGFHGLKLSPSLVAGAVYNPDTLKLIRSIISMADTFGMEVTAVGIENKEQMQQMKELGISKMQGYYFGRPATAEEFKL